MGDKVKDVIMAEVKWRTRLLALSRSRPWCQLHEPVGVKSARMATGLGIERGQSHSEILANDQPMRSTGRVSKAESRIMRGYHPP